MLSLLLLLIWTALWQLASASLFPRQYSNATGDSTDGFRYVDPLIGTAAGGAHFDGYVVISLTNPGHVFPGATMPFGMAKPVADVSSENQGGFSWDSMSLTGFSHMHDSGEILLSNTEECQLINVQARVV